MSDFEKMDRLARGPLRLTRDITNAGPTIRLFMTYLQQPITQKELLRKITEFYGFQGKEAASRARDALEILREVGVPRTHEKLCELVARAPALKIVWRYAATHVGKDILPEEARIPEEVIEECMEVYYAWMKTYSRKRR